MTTITVGEILDAMEKNGFAKAVGLFVKDIDGTRTRSTATVDPSNVRSACALGQVGINLKLDAVRIESACYQFDDGSYQRVWSNKHYRYQDRMSKTVRMIRELPPKVFRLNDETSKEVAQIARELRRRYRNYLDVAIEVLDS